MTESVTDSVGQVSKQKVSKTDMPVSWAVKTQHGCLDLRHFIVEKTSHRAKMATCCLFRHNARHTLEILTNELRLSNSCHELLREGSLQ